MGEQESEQKDVREKQEEVKVAINGNQEEETDGRNNFEEAKLEEERKKDGQEKRVSLGDPVNETAETREDKGLKEKREGEQNQSEEFIEGHETGKGTNEMQKGVTTEEEGKENQEEKGKEETGSLNKLTKLNPHHPNTVEEQQGQEGNLKPTTSPGPQSVIVDHEPPARQEKGSGEAVKKEEQERRQAPSPPKVVSAFARFQSQAHGQGFQVKSRTKELAEPGRPCNMLKSRENATHPPCDSNISQENKHSEGREEEDKPLIKVSELKKRFEA